MDAFEYAARQFEPPARRWATPGQMAREFDPRTVQTPALDLIDAALVTAATTSDYRLVVQVGPQEGKSVRCSEWFPLWLLQSNPDLRIVLASYEHGVARRWGRAVRDRTLMHPEVGLRVRDDLSAQHEWQLNGHRGGMYTTGIGGALTGRPADLMIIDDPVKGRAEADSKVYRERTWEWWTASASTRLAPGASVVLIMTRWHHEDLAGRLLSEDGSRWHVLNIPAQADHRPEKGETDILGREPGEFMVSARGRTREQWEMRKAEAGPRDWNALFQGRPTPGVGGIFPASDDWARYAHPLWVERDDGSRVIPDLSQDGVEIVQSWDLAFKDTDGSDYVVGQVWLRRGVHMYLLDQVRKRLSFTATLQAMREVSARWPQAVAKYVEDKANGPAVMSALASSMVGLIPVEPEGSKTARAHAVSPLCHSGNVVLPDAAVAPWVVDLTDECAEFPTGAHDDQVDALTQAVNRVLLMPIMAETIVTDSDLFEDDEDDAFAYLR